jgi:hypothetical protein
MRTFGRGAERVGTHPMGAALLVNFDRPARLFFLRSEGYDPCEAMKHVSSKGEYVWPGSTVMPIHAMAPHAHRVFGSAGRSTSVGARPGHTTAQMEAPISIRRVLRRR